MFKGCQAFFLGDYILLAIILTVSVGNTQRLWGDYTNSEYKVYYISLSQEIKNAERIQNATQFVCLKTFIGFHDFY